MLNKFTSITLAASLLVVLCGTSAFANNSSRSDVKTDTADVPSGAPAKTEVKPNEQLKNNMLKLVADAKAGKVLPAERPQIRPAKSNNLSKGAKIGIGVGIAAAVVTVIVITKYCRNEGGC